MVSLIVSAFILLDPLASRFKISKHMHDIRVCIDFYTLFLHGFLLIGCVQSL